MSNRLCVLITGVAILCIPALCEALIASTPVAPGTAKGMGIEVRAQAAGPDHAYIEIEFPKTGQLERYLQTRLSAADGDKQLFECALRDEERAKPDHVRVAFSVSRSMIDKLTITINTGFATSHFNYTLSLKEFVDAAKITDPAAEKAKLAAPAQEPAARPASPRK